MNNDSFVDLTISSPPLSADRRVPSMYVHRARSQRSLETSEGAQSPKRRRVDTSSTAGPSSHPARLHRQISILGNDPNIESIDLTEVNDRVSLAKALSKQREDATKAQNNTAAGVGGRSTLTAYKCPAIFSVINVSSKRFDLAKKEVFMMDMVRRLVADALSVVKPSRESIRMDQNGTLFLCS
ncbi:hypothetical protein ACJ72_00108 [Emergomyces africanus]|uniref:Uncharacterized protein n=1 Tax=Emergomyces africanus TaxID=1955775 RepID=A0A1B7P965_9EURO|nr:hypothetical protein ACJ72_00108 [Emergomyces africanus]